MTEKLMAHKPKETKPKNQEQLAIGTSKKVSDTLFRHPVHANTLNFFKCRSCCVEVRTNKNQRELYKMRSFFKSQAFYIAALFIELYPQLFNHPSFEESPSEMVGLQGVGPGRREDFLKSR